jgi:cell division protein FtsB
VKRLALLLAGLLLAIQWPLWFGHGSWLRVWDLQHQLAARQESNAALRAHNLALTAEMASLRQGSEAIEERARGELHMMRPDETFFELPSTVTATISPGQVASSQPLQFGLE